MKTKKLLITTIVVVLSAMSAAAQDIITQKDGTEIEASVSKVDETSVTYTRYGTTTPVYNVPKSEIFMIKYENGNKDVFEGVEQKFAVTVERPFKRSQFGLDFDLGVMQAAGVQGGILGGGIGFRILHNFNNRFGWNILKGKGFIAGDSSGRIATLQLMTGFRFKFDPRNYIALSAGGGLIAIDTDLGEDAILGVAFELGGGTYFTDTFFLEGFININSTLGSPLLFYGLKLGFDF